MTPRKREPRTVGAALAASIMGQRSALDWTQEELASRMRALGFAWARTTVAEVEGKGRKRQVTVPEVIGLATVFGVTVDDLLWPPAEKAPLELARGHEISERPHLIAMLLSPATLSTVVTDVLGRQVQDQIQRLASLYLDRVKEVATELRGVADFIEDRAAQTISGDTVKAMSAGGDQ